MATNKTLANAKTAKADEYYTRLVDIELELKYYKTQLYGKTIFCNCDDPFESNFFKYFAMNFNHLGLKKLICTSYDTSPIVYTQLAFIDGKEEVIPNKHRKAYKIEISEVDDYNGDGAIDLADVEYLLKNKKNTLSLLDGDGDFRSEECVELLKQADIVVTNPPFSLFKEYISQLIQFDKKFLIIGNKNSITYKEVFSLIKEEKIWLGYRNINADMWFVVPSAYNYEKIINGQRVKHIMGCWFTNLDTKKRHEIMPLYKKYNPEEYPKYETYDAIDVGAITDIPCDYFGVMGVPKTFLDKYNPEQFEIIGYEREDENIQIGIRSMPEEFLKKYREQGGRGHYTKGMKMLCYYNREGQAKIPFSRILIRRK